MELPIYREIEFQKKELKTEELILAKLKALPLSKAPFYFETEKYESSKATQVIHLLEQVFKESENSPFFPYPTYIIGKVEGDFFALSTLKSVKNLPKHFSSQRSEKNVTSREVSLIRKIQILALKVMNFDILKIRKDFLRESQKHKTLYQMTKELEFYQSLILKIDELEQNDHLAKQNTTRFKEEDDDDD